MTVEVEFEEPTRLPVHSGWYARVFSGRRCLFSTPGCVIRQHRSGPPRRIARNPVPLRLTAALPTLELRGVLYGVARRVAPPRPPWVLQASLPWI